MPFALPTVIFLVLLYDPLGLAVSLTVPARSPVAFCETEYDLAALEEDPNYSIQYESARSEVRAQLGLPKLPVVNEQYDPREDEARDRLDGVTHYLLTLQMGDASALNTQMRYTLSGNTLSFDVAVHPEFRDKRINRLFMLDILRRHPEISSIHNDYHESNLANFIVAVGDGATGERVKALAEKRQSTPGYEEESDKNFCSVVSKARTNSEKAVLRQRILAAISNEIPDGRNVKRLGFGRISRIIIGLGEPDQPSIDLSVEYQKGDPDPRKKPQILIEEYDDEGNDLTRQI